MRMRMRRSRKTLKTFTTRMMKKRSTLFDQAVVRRRGERGPQQAPVKERMSLQLLPEVVDYFKAGGSGWQTRLDQALKEYVVDQPRG